MPKLFSIKLKVEEIALGRVMHTLHNMPGIAGVDLDLDDIKVKPAGGNGSGKVHGSAGKPRPQYDVRGTDLVLQLLHKKAMGTGELRAAFEAAGRSGLSIASPIHTLKNDGDIAMGPDGYALTKKARDRLNKRKK